MRVYLPTTDTGAGAANPSGTWASEEGQSFLQNHAPRAIDFATIHNWADNWQVGANETFQATWLQRHAEAARDILRKPLIVSDRDMLKYFDRERPWKS